MGGWKQVGGLAINRYYHSATLLPDGKVLLAVGETPTTELTPTAELYDPGSETCSPTGSPFLGRFFPGGVRLPSNDVLVAGGVGIGSLDQLRSTELYNPQKREWYPTGLLNLSRQLAESVALQDGRVMIIGGVEDGQAPPPTGSAPSALFNSCEIYDPSTQAWVVTGSLSIGRFHHTATVLFDGRVLVVGGSAEFSKNTPELYDPVIGVWQFASEPHHSRTNHTATLLADGKVLVAGNNAEPENVSAEIYDPVNDAWFLVGNLITGRGGHAAVRLNDGRVLVQGGFGLGAVATSAEIYDPEKLGWTSAGNTEYPRLGHTLTLLNHRSLLQQAGRSQVLLAGGSANSTCEIYDTGSEHQPVRPVEGSAIE
jgi:hypothetical protein